MYLRLLYKNLKNICTINYSFGILFLQLSVRRKNTKEMFGGFFKSVVKSADEVLFSGVKVSDFFLAGLENIWCHVDRWLFIQRRYLWNKWYSQKYSNFFKFWLFSSTHFHLFSQNTLFSPWRGNKSLLTFKSLVSLFL